MTPPPSKLGELVSWFQGIPEIMDKFSQHPMIDKKGDDEIIQNIGLSLGIEPLLWNGMTHDKRLLTIYEQLPDGEKLAFEQAAPHLFKPKPKFDYRILDNNKGGKRNKSKKPKRRNSRSKRRKTLSKRRR